MVHGITLNPEQDRPIPHLRIARPAWLAAGPSPDEELEGVVDREGDAHTPSVYSRLLAQVEINGLSCHLEAWEVYVDRYGMQQPVWNLLDLDALALAVSAEGHWQTVTIEGREYILVLSPYC